VLCQNNTFVAFQQRIDTSQDQCIIDSVVEKTVGNLMKYVLVAVGSSVFGAYFHETVLAVSAESVSMLHSMTVSLARSIVSVLS
jgi:hypothetical protein